MLFGKQGGRLAAAVLGAAFAVGSAGWSGALRAETPADTLVIADFIDDIVSLDPAESFEFSGNDALNNIYDTLIELDPTDLGPLVPGLAESWDVAEDGVTYTFKIREGVTFHSGNPVTAEDAAWSLQRVIKLDKTPSFILNQFGFTAENVEEKIKATGEYELTIVTDQAYAPSFFYNCLTAVVASIVDKETALAHEQDGDLGYGWLKSNSAGSGAYSLRVYKPSDSYVLEAHESYWRGAPALKRVFVRHVAEPATQRLLLERGDIDIARKLTPIDVAGIADNADLKVQSDLKGRLRYFSLNQKVEPLNDPKVIEAFKYLVDYEGMTGTFLKGQWTVHQSFLPDGFLGAIPDTPYELDVEKAKSLLAEAGAEDLAVRILVRNEQATMEVAQSLQNTFAQAGIDAELHVGTGAETLTEYRARKHDIYLGDWGPDYPDPHTNAATFAHNPDNADEAKLTGVLAWRNAWAAEELTAMTEAAVLERDTAERTALYEEIQRIHQQTSPFAIMFQLVQQDAMQANIEGFSAGGSIHSAFYWNVTKQ